MADNPADVLLAAADYCEEHGLGPLAGDLRCISRNPELFSPNAPSRVAAPVVHVPAGQGQPRDILLDAARLCDEFGLDLLAERLVYAHAHGRERNLLL